MEEVRSYWQVASITHFCNIFGKPFKLPTFEPEELEQAFILELPTPPAAQQQNSLTDGFQSTDSRSPAPNPIPSPSDQNGRDKSTSPMEPETPTTDDCVFTPPPPPPPPSHMHQSNYLNDNNIQSNEQQQELNNQPQQAEDQQELHLLVKLAIALLRPHFNYCKISHTNWENYLRRIVDANWVELEHHPSPFRVPIISQDGVELTKNLTFNELSLSDKIDLIYALCDYRLWCEDAADFLKDWLPEELRLESIGKDSQGYEYWYFSGTRLYRENKEMSQDLIVRKKRIKELEYKLIELDKARIFREKEAKRRAEIERAKRLAEEARESRLAAKKEQKRESTKRRKQTTPILPPRTGLRERRSSATSNNNESTTTRGRVTRNKQQDQQREEEQPQQNTQKTTRGSSRVNVRQTNHNNNKNGRNHQRENDNKSVESSNKSPEEECKEELQRLKISPEDRAEAWSMHCDSLESWESFLLRFEKTKSTNEKYLYSYLNEELLPIIRGIYGKRAAEVRKKEKELLFSLTTRRTSSRIINKKAQEEEEERQAQLHEAEMRRKKVEAETRLRAELEREMRAKRNKFVVNGGTSSTCSEDGDETVGRYNLRQGGGTSMESDEFNGIIHPDKLSVFYEALELIIDTVRTSKHAWPFVHPVPQTVPGYYDLIKEPMDLMTIRTKIEFREYKSLIELEKDFQLMINNCEEFNGPKNVYTKMSYRLWKSFRKNVRIFLERDLHMNEQDTFLYPPPPRDDGKVQESIDGGDSTYDDTAADRPGLNEDNAASAPPTPAEVQVDTTSPDLKAPTPEPVTPTREPTTTTPEPKAPTPEPMTPISEPKAPTPEPPTPETITPISELVPPLSSAPLQSMHEPNKTNGQPEHTDMTELRQVPLSSEPMVWEPESKPSATVEGFAIDQCDIIIESADILDEGFEIGACSQTVESQIKTE